MVVEVLFCSLGPCSRVVPELYGVVDSAVRVTWQARAEGGMKSCPEVGSRQGVALQASLSVI